MNKRQSNTISENWVLNNGNIFGLPKDDAISLSTIHLEILRQTENKKIDTISDFLNFKIDINKEINSAGDYTIKRIFLEELSVSETYLHREEIEISIIYSLIQLWFFKKLVNQNHPEFLTLDYYKKIFAKRRTDFLDKKNDTIGDDFVKNEIKTCNKVLKELKKPVYNKINYLWEITKEPAPFKEDLTNRINRRLEFLKDPRFTEESLQKLTNKFNHIGFLDYKEVITETYRYKTITSKLDYLKTVKEKHYDKHEQVVSALSVDENILYSIHRDIIEESIFGKNNLTPSLKIQEPVYDEFFKEEWNNPEFKYWFLKYNAKLCFNSYINDSTFKSKINSSIKNTFLESLIKQIDEVEKKAKDLVIKNEIDIYNHHKNNYKYKKEIEVLRVLTGNYYKDNATYFIPGIGSIETQAYFKHILLKPYLEKLLKDITNEKNIQPRIEYSTVTKEDGNKPPIKLIDLFDHVSKYNEVMELLVTKQYIHADTFIWIDENKGHKGLLVSIIKDLHHKGFFSKKPPQKQILEICKNTFHLEISLDTIKTVKKDSFDLSFIPLSK